MGRGDGPGGRRADCPVHARHADRRVPSGRDAAHRPGPPARRRAGHELAGPSLWRAAGRLGSVRAGQPRGDLVVLRPSEAPSDGTMVGPSADPTDDSLATIAPTSRPELPRPYLDGIEFHYYEDGDALAADYAAGFLDAISGVDPAVAADIAEPGDSRLLRYPGSTLTAVLFNLRGHPAFASSAARIGLHGRSIARRSSTMRTAVRVSAPTRSSRRARPCSRGRRRRPSRLTSMPRGWRSARAAGSESTASGDCRPKTHSRSSS